MAVEEEKKNMTTLQSPWHVLDDVEELLEGRYFQDVTFHCADGQVMAHKVMLASASPFLYKLLGSVSRIHIEISLPEVKSIILKQVLTFVYTGWIKGNLLDAQDIRDLAKALDIDPKDVKEMERPKCLQHQWDMCSGATGEEIEEDANSTLCSSSDEEAQSPKAGTDESDDPGNAGCSTVARKRKRIKRHFYRRKKHLKMDIIDQDSDSDDPRMSQQNSYGEEETANQSGEDLMQNSEDAVLHLAEDSGTSSGFTSPTEGRGNAKKIKKDVRPQLKRLEVFKINSESIPFYVTESNVVCTVCGRILETKKHCKLHEVLHHTKMKENSAPGTEFYVSQHTPYSQPSLNDTLACPKCDAVYNDLTSYHGHLSSHGVNHT